VRKFAISDIHGCLKPFKALLEQISFSKEDELYLLGDYIDRGPDSRGVIDHIWNLQELGYTVHCLRGNHEQMLLYNIDAKDELVDIAEVLGYPETLSSFGVEEVDRIPKVYIDWINSLPYFMEVDQYLLVHAGLNFKNTSPLNDREALIWIRHWYDKIDREWLGNRIVIHGHTPIIQSEIIRSISELAKTPVINIDNGCCFETLGFGNLCVLELGRMKLTFQGWTE